MLAPACLLGAAAGGQHAEADDVERIEPPRVKPSQGEKKLDLGRVAAQIGERTNAFRKDESRNPPRRERETGHAADFFAGFVARTDRSGQ